MKKQILNLGKALNKAEQKQVNGGVWGNLKPEPCACYSNADCNRPGICGDVCVGLNNGANPGTCASF